jgi:hypothetical protein
MKTFLVSYDLGVPESSSDYQKVIDYIQSFGNWAKPLKSQWFIVSSKSCSEIRDDLSNLTDFNDGILVLEVSGDGWATSRISSEVTSWMEKNL